MRTTFDRLRHTICFELIGLVILTLGVAKLINMDMAKIGILAVAFSIYRNRMELLLQHLI